MTRSLKFALLLTLAASAPVEARMALASDVITPGSPTPVDPARLSAARALMDQIMPLTTRDQMMKSMMASMSQNMLQALRKNPDFEAMLEKEPGAQPIFDRFLDRQMALGTEDLIANLPSMLDAMAHAYARRFTLAQLNDMSTFFSTPTGQAYLTKAPTIMADPDVSAWTKDLMARSMKRMPEETAKLKAEIEALNKKGGHS